MDEQSDLAAQYRCVLGHFPSGVVVVTGRCDDGPAGLTVQSFTALSLQPPMILLSIDRKSTTWPRIAATGKFAVNILAQGQEAVAMAFAKSGADKFAGIDWAPGEATGAPLLRGCQAWIEAETAAVHDGGDHVIVTADVRSLRADSDVAPLIFFRSAFHRLDQPVPAAG